MRRRRNETETPIRREIPRAAAQERSQDVAITVAVVQPETDSNGEIVDWARQQGFIHAGSDDAKSWIIPRTGIGFSSRLRHVLPFIASCEPLADALRGDVVGRLLSYDASVGVPRRRQSAPNQVQLSADKWMAQVRAWASSHPQRDRVVDDSRESIYGDRL